MSTTPTAARPVAPQEVVDAFLAHVTRKEVDAAADLLAPGVRYTNVSLPSIVGRERVRRVLHTFLDPPASGVEIYVHTSAVDGDVVLDERTDALSFGPFRMQFWVYGRFEVHDGLIEIWRDSFDWLNVLGATARGLAGIAVPALRAKPPRA